MLTKDEFIKLYNENKPNVVVRFIYKYFNVKLNNKPIPWGSWFGILCFAIATIGMIYFGDFYNGGNKALGNQFVWIYLGFVAMFPLTLYAFLNNKINNKRIANKMGITEEEYNKYCTMYL